MTREVSIPLALWICAALCAHFLLGGGGFVLGKVHEDRNQVLALLIHSRERTKMEEQTFEVALVADPSQPPDEEQKPPEDAKPPEDQDKPVDPEKKDDVKPVPTTPPTPTTPPKPEPKKEKLADDKKKEEEKKVVLVEKKEEEKKTPPPEDVLKDHRIAVRQHVKDNQADNPNARFIADQANKVDNETVATQTSHDRDDKNPTPGGNHAGPNQQPGDSERTKIAESEEHKGEKNRAPGEKGTEFDIQKDPPPKNPSATPVQAPITEHKTPVPPAPAGDNHPKAPAPTPAPQPQPQPAVGQPAVNTPAVQEGPQNSAFDWTKQQPGAPGAPGAQPAKPAASQAITTPMFGLGQRSAPGKMNLNLTQQAVAEHVVGADNLRKMREADGERRKSEHRGSWVASNFERWRSAIENYVSSVKPGNQTALNAAQSPFATYLNSMHNRIHPIFADNFLGSLDALPKEHPLNDQHMITRLEIVLTRDGHVQKMGIVKTSGVTAFDIAALDSVNRAQPFGPAPAAIVSPDGNVYLHWEFHRDEVYACSTMNARPFILNVPAKGPEQTPEPPPPANPSSPTKERGAPPPNTRETREGALPPRRIGPG